MPAEHGLAQVFVGRNAAIKDNEAFERKLFVIRKVAERKIRYGGKIPGGNIFYVSSLSARTLIYKGMLMSEQVEKRECTSAIAVVTVASRKSG